MNKNSWLKDRLYALISIVLGWVIILLAIYGAIELYEKYIV